MKAASSSDGFVSQQKFTCTYRVSYADCTAVNHVYHSRYLDILDRARGEFFRSVNCTFLQLQQEDVIFPVAECRMKFMAAARYDDLLTIEMWLSQLGRVRLSFTSCILDAQGNRLIEAYTKHGCTHVDGTLCRIPAALAAALRPYLASAESEA